MQGISRNIVISVMLHSVLLAAVFAIGNSSMQQTKQLLIVSLFEEWQKGEAAGPVQSLSGGSAQKTPAGSPAQSRPGSRVPPELARDMTADTHTPDSVVPSAQARTSLPETGEVPDIRSALSSGSRGEAAGGRILTATAGGTALPSGKSGPETTGPGTSTAGKGRQAEEPDPGLRRRLRDTLQANLVYPYLARKKRIEGTVLAEFRLNSSGMPENMRIVRTSHYEILDEAAKETIQKAAPFPAQNRRVEIPITFRLRDGK